MNMINSFFPVRLGDINRDRLREHFLQLDASDRHLRFGASQNDAAVIAYVEQLDFARDEVYAVSDDVLRILGAIHIAVLGDQAELGLSVLPCVRGQGVGNALFARAVMHLQNRGVHDVMVRCLYQNAAMMHLAHKFGMTIEDDGADREAHLLLPAATSGSYMLEWLQDQHASYVSRLQHGTRVGQSLLAALPIFGMRS